MTFGPRARCCFGALENVGGMFLWIASTRVYQMGRSFVPSATNIIEKVELSADDIATIEKIMRTEFEPKIRELTTDFVLTIWFSPHCIGAKQRSLF